MKRICLLLLVLLLCLGALAGCGREEEIPDGFILATCKGEPFRLYLPSAWNSNVGYGVSGGYYNLFTTSVVRLDTYARESAVEADAFYNDTLRPALSAALKNLVEKESPSDTLLGELNAKRYHETASFFDSSLEI